MPILRQDLSDFSRMISPQMKAPKYVYDRLLNEIQTLK